MTLPCFRKHAYFSTSFFRNLVSEVTRTSVHIIFQKTCGHQISFLPGAVHKTRPRNNTSYYNKSERNAVIAFIVHDHRPPGQIWNGTLSEQLQFYSPCPLPNSAHNAVRKIHHFFWATCGARSMQCAVCGGHQTTKAARISATHDALCMQERSAAVIENNTSRAFFWRRVPHAACRGAVCRGHQTTKAALFVILLFSVKHGGKKKYLWMYRATGSFRGHQ